MTEVSFDSLLAGCKRSAVKLEMRDSYMTSDPAYVAWQAGEPVDQVAARYADWTDLIRATVAQGVAVQRVRVVSEPVSDYIRYEHAVTAAVSLDGGEEIRWLSRQAAAHLLLPASDVWVLDDSRALFLYFSGDGDLVGSELTEDAETVKGCASAFAAAWDRAVVHEGYRV